MKKEVPVANRLVQERDQLRNNQRLLHNIVSTKVTYQQMQFSNISSIKHGPIEKKKSKPHPIDLTKILGPGSGSRRVKTVLEKSHIQSENRGLYDRLARQKSTISAKFMMEERQKNLQYLRRIRRYPYRRVQSVVEHQRNTYQTPQRQREEDRFHQRRRTDYRQMQTSSTNLVQEEDRDIHHLIVLFSKVIQLKTGWNTVKILRYKNHYGVSVATYPNPRREYTLQLPELIGTALLSQTDYDYLFICQNCIKFNPQFVCFTFELNQPERKKYFYRFESKNMRVQEEKGTQLEQKQIEKDNEVESGQDGARRTMFAVENDRREREMQRKLKTVKQQNEDQEEYDFGKLSNFNRSDIQLNNL